MLSSVMSLLLVDLKYFQDTNGGMGFGFPLGVVPFTNLAVGLPIEQGGALVNTVNVSAELTPAVRAKGITEAVRSYNLQGAMKVLPVPSVAVAGLSNGSWCNFCDSFATSVVNYQAGCYLSNQDTCGILDYPLVHPKIGGWVLNMYNLTSPAGGQTEYSSEQGTYQHPWTNMLYQIVTEGRSDAPAGCNYTGGYTCIGNGCSTGEPTSLVCPAATIASDLSGGFGALLSAVEYQWAYNLNASSKPGSFLGYERLRVDSVSLGKVVSAAEKWGYEIVSGAVQTTVLYYDQVLSVTGFATTWLTSFIAIVGAWAAYEQISDFLIKALGSRLWGWQHVLGKFLAGATTIVATLAPLVIVIASQHSLNTNNERRVQRSYFQAAYDAPGTGAYKLVVIAEVDVRARTNHSPLSLGLPLFAALLIFDLVAWVLSERVVARSANLRTLNRLNSLQSV